MTSRQLSFVGAVSVGFLVGGCAHSGNDVDAGEIEAWLFSTKPEIRLARQTRILDWEDAKNEGVPKDHIVWIQYWDGKPCQTTSSPPIGDVKAFIDEFVERMGDVWVAIQPWDLSSQTIEGYRDLLGVCARSRAKGVIVAEVRYRNEPAYRFRAPSPRLPNISQLIKELEEKTKNQTAQPGATDNPDDARRLREDH